MRNNERKLNPEHLRCIMEITNGCPYYRLLGMRIVELGSGYAKAVLDAEHRHENPFGGIHGGVYASMIDCATYWAGYCDQDEDAGFTTLDLSVNDLSMAKHGTLTVTAHAVKQGRSICMCQAEIHDEAGRLIAYGTSKLLMLKGRQSVADAVRAANYPELPPKFLD